MSLHDEIERQRDILLGIAGRYGGDQPKLSGGSYLGWEMMEMMSYTSSAI